MHSGSDGVHEGNQRLRVKDYIIYYLGYTVLFAVMAAAVFVWFWMRKKRFVWQTDGVNQHYYGLLYFSRWGKEVLQQFRETHVLRVPTFSLRIGYGEDLFTTLAYYVIGDPFSLPAILVPEQYLLHFHDLMLMVRFWLAGITFSAYAFYMGKRSRLGVLAGALIYIFNGFTMSGMRHHYFLNPFVFFPLLLIGCERYFRKKKAGLFIFMVFISAVSNFYFFYMLVIMTVLYAVWRSLRLRGLRHFGRVLLDGIAFLFYGLVGTMLAAVVFLPVVLRFLQDPRAADSKSVPLFWTESFYRNFIDCFLSNGTSALSESWTYMGFGAVAACCVLFIFAQRKKHFDLKAAFIGLTCLLMTPLAGYVMNGFSYPANRWMWAYALLVGYMTATAFPELMEAGRKLLLALFALMFVLVLVCAFWSYTFSRASGTAYVLGLFGLGAVLLGHMTLLEKKAEGVSISEQVRGRITRRVHAALLVCVMLTIAAAGYFDYAPDRSAKIFEYLSRAQIETQTAKDSAAAAELIDGNLLKPKDEKTPVPFYRYTTYNPENNTSMLYGVSNTQYYWSLSNSNTAQFLSETGQLNRMIHQYDSLDDRTYLNEIAGIRYFLGDDKAGVPYGYEKKEGLSYDNYDLWPELELVDRYSCEIYENKYALPFGFTSGKWISREAYDAMDIPQRQEALMQGILLDRKPADNFENIDKSVVFSDKRMPVVFSFDAEKITAEGLDPVDTAATAGTTTAGTAAAPAGTGAADTTAAPAGTNAKGTGAAGTAAAPAGTNAKGSGATGTAAAPAGTDEKGSGAADTAAAPAGTDAAGAAADAGAAGTASDPDAATVQTETVNTKEALMTASEKGGRISFEIHEAGTAVSLLFSGLPDSETGVYLRGMQYQPPEGQSGSTKYLLPVRGFSGDKQVTDKQFGFTTPMDPWTTGQTDFLVNMRYHGEAMDRIEITFPATGTFSFDSIEAVCQPMAGYAAQAQAFRESVLEDLDIHEMGDSCATDLITGHIDLKEPKILCLQIPCTPGWSAYVDGVRAELLQADTMFSAILLPAGSHDIELRYQTPGLRLGAIVSIGTFLLILLFGIIYSIVSLILHFMDRRRESVPVGDYKVESDPDGGFREDSDPAGEYWAETDSAGDLREDTDPAGEYREEPVPDERTDDGTGPLTDKAAKGRKPQTDGTGTDDSFQEPVTSEENGSHSE